MASGHEVELIISSAKDLKNVNWRYGPIRPYAVVWVDPNNKCSTKADEEGDTCPYWEEKLVIPLPGPVHGDTTLFIDIIHAGREEDTKKLIGSARLKLREVLDDTGVGERVKRTLTLKRPSGRPHGKVEVKLTIIEPRYAPPSQYYAPPYGVQGSRDYHAPPPYGNRYASPPPTQDPYYSSAPPPSGYPYNAPPAAYGQAPYGQAPYGQGSGGYYGVEEKKKSKFGGMGTGLAVGAVAGVLGGLAIAEGVDAFEDHVAEKAAEQVEEDNGYDDDDF